jgi:hypothetical protein
MAKLSENQWYRGANFSWYQLIGSRMNARQEEKLAVCPFRLGIRTTILRALAELHVGVQAMSRE